MYVGPPTGGRVQNRVFTQGPLGSQRLSGVPGVDLPLPRSLPRLPSGLGSPHPLVGREGGTCGSGVPADPAIPSPQGLAEGQTRNSQPLLKRTVETRDPYPHLPSPLPPSLPLRPWGGNKGPRRGTQGSRTCRSPVLDPPDRLPRRPVTGDAPSTGPWVLTRRNRGPLAWGRMAPRTSRSSFWGPSLGPSGSGTREGEEEWRRDTGGS